ncbi:MAG: isoprenylcysteine carboxylmethyltransferase family protein [Nitrospirae bacterium]|nr:isoprenylcysteine carboxylmethyltransferase family protein [Nitrospirota bacterium]
MNFIYWLRHFISHNRIATSFALGLIFILFSRPTTRSILIGTPVILLGEFFRTLSSGYLEKNSSLSIDGPYSVTRNPMYSGNFLLGLGFVIIVNQPILLVLFVMLFAFIYQATIIEEEKRLQQRFGQEFSAYMSSVPRFFPKLWRWKSNGRSFNWTLVMKHREYVTWLGIVAGILLLTAKMFFYSQ